MLRKSNKSHHVNNLIKRAKIRSDEAGQTVKYQKTNEDGYVCGADQLIEGEEQVHSQIHMCSILHFLIPHDSSNWMI